MRVVIISAVVLLMGNSAVAGTSQTLESEEAKLSYIFGHQLGQRLVSDGIEVDVDAYGKGLRDGLQSVESQISPAEAQVVMERFQASAEERRQALGENNRAAGLAYLAENSKNPDIIVLENGLQYKVIKQGDGAKPKAVDTVKVHYRGTLIDGREFDSSYRRDEPATFPVNRVIAGWTAILQMMPVGSHYQVTIPSELAYGERGTPPMIKPHSVLIFDIELLNIEE